MSYRVSTQVYTGPFDLLLQLVSKQKVDISALSISELTDQYLAEIQRMETMDLDVASDFVLVASTLLDIKAQALVPDDDRYKRQSSFDDDEDDELLFASPQQAREVLIARLIAYKQFRNAAAALGARMEAEARMHPRCAGPDANFLNVMPNYLEGITLRGLAVICADLDSRKESFLLEADHIAPKRLPLALTITSVDRLLRAKRTMKFSELLDEASSKEQVVVTFLAILELFKHGSIHLSQPELFGEISLEQVEGAPEYHEDATEFDEELDDKFDEQATDEKLGENTDESGTTTANDAHSQKHSQEED